MKKAEREALIEALRTRFEQNMQRHKGIRWSEVVARLEASPDSLGSLHEMEKTGGEPDVVGRAAAERGFRFCDCSAESPSGRRSLCFDRDGLNARKEHKPAGSAMDMAAAMRIAILTEAEYRALQELGEFDLKTSSWVATPQEIRKLGGALFCDRRYDTVFVYHNGAQSYYAARGFRGSLIV